MYGCMPSIYLLLPPGYLLLPPGYYRLGACMPITAGTPGRAMWLARVAWHGR